MTPTTDETAGGSGGDGEGLCESTANGSLPADSPHKIIRSRPGAPCAEQKMGLPISRSVVESPEMPTTVAGRRPSGKSRIRSWSGPSSAVWRAVALRSFRDGVCRDPSYKVLTFKVYLNSFVRIINARECPICRHVHTRASLGAGCLAFWSPVAFLA